MSTTPRRITVYRYRYCPTCERGVPLLDRYHIPYEEVNAGEDPDAARLIEQVANGQWVTPIIAIDDAYYVCPSEAELARLLELE